MKIAFIINNMQSGGAERTVALLSNYGEHHGHDVTIITLDNLTSFYELNPSIAHICLNIYKENRTLCQALLKNFYRVKVIKKTLSGLHPDAVICFAPNTLLLSYLARGRLKYKLIGSERTNPYMARFGFWNKSKRWISRLCDGYIFQTKGALRYYPESTRSKSIIMPNCIVSDQFTSIDKPWSERRDICAVGRMDADKCFSDLLTAFSAVHEQHIDVHLDLYGDGPLRSELEQLTALLGLESAVTFHGRCSQIYEVYSKHKLFVMSSRYEGMPNVLLEALASGCACVSTDCDFGPSELIKDGFNGFLVPVHDTVSMAERICRLLNNGNLCLEFSNAAKSVRQTHDICNIGVTFLRYIESL